MVVCVIAFAVLAVLGIFSAKYRRWAREAFSCVKRRAMLRPCDTGFDEKVKAAVTSMLMQRHGGLARFTHRHFEALSWVFTASLLLSMAYSGYTIYNLAAFGTCDPQNPQDCIFNPGGDPNRVVCPYEGLNPAASAATIGGFMDIQSASIAGRPAVYFFGTTWCPHCGWERPIFMNTTAMFSGFIDMRVTDIDQSQPPVEMALFKHYSPNGQIPLIVIGGKYYRVGSGEGMGESGERLALTALLCKATGSPIDGCKASDVIQMIGEL